MTVYKKVLFLTAIVVVCVISVALINKLSPPDQQTLSHYAYQTQKNLLVRRANQIEPKTVVYLGSSTAQGLNVGAIAQNGMNLGIGAETLTQLLERTASYHRLSDSNTLVFIAGFNDLCDQIDEVNQRFEQLVGRFDDNPKVIVSMQPAQSPRLCAHHGDNRIQYNGFLKSFCEQDSRCVFVDAEQALAGATANLENTAAEVLEPDGIHLNRTGYIRLSEAITEALEQLKPIS